MHEYNWEETLHELSEYYYTPYLLETYFKYATNPPQTEHAFLSCYFIWDKDKIRDENGRVIQIVRSWDDEHVDDYDEIFSDFNKLICEQYAKRRDMNGLYKYLAFLIKLHDDTFPA